MMRLFKYSAKEYDDNHILNNKDRLSSHRRHNIVLPDNLLKIIRKELIGEFRGVKFFRVDGEVLRDKVDLDWVLGGNPGRYAYIPDFPDAEIWVEADNLEDILDVCVHEFVEMMAMIKKKLTYDKGHALANKYELFVRRHHRLRKFSDFTKFIDEYVSEIGKFKKLPKVEEKVGKFASDKFEEMMENRQPWTKKDFEEADREDHPSWYCANDKCKAFIGKDAKGTLCKKCEDSKKRSGSAKLRLHT